MVKGHNRFSENITQLILKLFMIVFAMPDSHAGGKRAESRDQTFDVPGLSLLRFADRAN